MWRKIVDLATDIRVKIAVAVLGLVPSLSLVLKLFSLITDDYEIVTFSALEFRKIYIQYRPSLEMLISAILGPTFIFAFVFAVLTGAAAIGLSFIRKKAATICMYVLSSLSCYAPIFALSFLLPMFEEETEVLINFPVMIIFLFWGALMLPIIMAGIALAAISKNYG